MDDKANGVTNGTGDPGNAPDPSVGGLAPTVELVALTRGPGDYDLELPVDAVFLGVETIEVMLEQPKVLQPGQVSGPPGVTVPVLVCAMSKAGPRGLARIHVRVAGDPMPDGELKLLGITSLGPIVVAAFLARPQTDGNVGQRT